MTIAARECGGGGGGGIGEFASGIDSQTGEAADEVNLPDGTVCNGRCAA